MSFRFPALPVAILLLCTPLTVAHGQASNGYENLQVLPADIDRNTLNEIMLANLQGLGLPRVAGEGCLYCHVGSMDVPRREWDYAADDKVTKQKARVMLRMMREINQRHLPSLPSRTDQSFQITCYSCHAGRTDPRPLNTILLEAYRAGGVDSLAARYHDLRDRYYAADAYDFRPGTLTGIASSLTDTAMDDAVTIAALNRDANPDQPAAARAWVQFRMLRALNGHDANAALAELDALTPTLAPGVLSPDIIDGLAWTLMRNDAEDAAKTLIRANHDRFPDQYRATESLAFVLQMDGRTPDALQLLERWLERHPDHSRARTLLLNMRGR